MIGREARGRATAALGGLGWAGALRIAGAPWWAVLALAILQTIMMFALTCLQTVFPQESAHRADWWRDRQAHGRATAGE